MYKILKRIDALLKTLKHNIRLLIHCRVNAVYKKIDYVNGFYYEYKLIFMVLDF